MKTEIPAELMKTARKAQINEELGSLIYAFMAKREKVPANKEILEHMSRDEKSHAKIWKNITKKKLTPSPIYVSFIKIVTIIMGFTFVVKKMQKSEQLTQDTYRKLNSVVPELVKMIDDEHRHEKQLYAMLDEDRLHYVGAIVLGLNDALVELTGAITGVTFALANNQLIALTGIITGVSATLSMAASNYLAEKSAGRDNAFKASMYTGGAYLIAVVLLVLPYLLLPSDMYIHAFIIMIVTVILIIMFFNYYLSVAKDKKFLKNFARMAIISLGVAAISFIIGIIAKNLLGLEI